MKVPFVPDAAPSDTVGQVSPWLVRSRLSGVVPLPDGGALAAHLLGRTRVACDPAAVAFLAQFAMPLRPEQAEPLATGAPDDRDRTAALLRRAGLLRPAGNGEAERIRDIYALSLAPAPRPATLTRLPAAVTSPPLALEDGKLWLSPYLARLTLRDGSLLAAHPTGSPVEMTEDLWQFAELFQGGATVPDAAALACLPVETAQRAARFLRHRGLLWSSPAAEIAEAQTVAANLGDGAASSDALRAGFPTENRWRQRFAPCTLADAASTTETASVALLGPCQVQLFAEALEYLAARDEGLLLDAIGFLEPEDGLADRSVDLVLAAATPYAAAFYDALRAGRTDRMERLIPELLSRVEDLVFRVRACTEAPLLLLGLSRPGLSLSLPGESATRDTAHLIAEVNRRTEEAVRGYGRVHLFDPDDALGGFPGRYWDDEYNALPHHSALSNWSWVTLKPGVTDAPYTTETRVPIPVPLPHQSDPGGALAAEMLRFLRATRIAPAQLVLLEPDDLLWPGRLGERDTPYDAPPSMYADVEEYYHAGLHEALSHLKRSGVRLAAYFSDGDPDDMRARWQVGPEHDFIVRYEMLDVLVAGMPAHAAVGAVTASTGVAEQDIVWLSRTTPPPDGFTGWVTSAPEDCWSLRRLLLRDPALHPLTRPVLPALSTVTPDPAPVLHPARSVSAFDDDRFWTVVARRIGCPEERVRASTDLRDAGLDSLGGIELLCDLEAAFGVRFEDTDRTEPVVFRPRALRGAVERAVRRAHAGSTGPSARPRHTVAGLPFLAPAEADLASLLEERLANPQHPWVFQLVRSASRWDTTYLTGPLLLRRAAGASEQMRTAGVRTGDRVLLALPFGEALLAFFFGALLAGFVPLIGALPPTTDGGAACAAWLRTLMEQSEARLAVLPPGDHEALSGQVLIVTDETALPEHDAPRRTAPGEASRPAILLHSSGTTGVPKIGSHSHASIASRLEELAGALRLDHRKDRLVSWVPLHHTIGVVNTLLLPVLLGVPAVLLPPALFAARPDAFLRVLSDERGTFTFMPNFAFSLLARTIPAALLPELDLSPVRALVGAGEPVAAGALDALHRVLAPAGLRRATLSSGFGMAEAAGAITQASPDHPPRRVRVTVASLNAGEPTAPVPTADEPDPPSVTLVSCGAVLPLLTARIRRGGADGPLMPDGRIGEIEICTPSLMQPLHADRPVTALTEDGFLRTGDLGFKIGRELFVTGRVKEIIIVAGRNIHPVLVEEAAENIPGVASGSTVAFGIDDTVTGTSALALGVETSAPEAEQERIERAIREAIRLQCGVPVRTLTFVPPGTLERTPSGKLMRGRSAERLRTQVGNESRTETPDAG